MRSHFHSLRMVGAPRFRFSWPGSPRASRLQRAGWQLLGSGKRKELKTPDRCVIRSTWGCQLRWRLVAGVRAKMWQTRRGFVLLWACFQEGQSVTMHWTSRPEDLLSRNLEHRKSYINYGWSLVRLWPTAMCCYMCCAWRIRCVLFLSVGALPTCLYWSIKNTH